MTARITGRATLPALVAASVVAVAAPAAARVAVPAHAPDRAPAAESAPRAVPVQKNGECAKALGILEQIKLLPGRPDLAKTLCTLVSEQPANEQPVSEPLAGDEQAGASGEFQQLQMPRDYTPSAAGQPTEANTHPHDVADHKDRLLGLPVAWPEGLTVWIPTLQHGEWHSYSHGRDGTAGAGAADAGAPAR
ncbi:hypothetical protein [Actinomadura sp. WMMB 499]|uniref:hypothetical protein n=1 Tax=Actinomadura sp. WMMB 499 TaxID=1219491 RepID=UPI001246FD46|nr:hypothetical protein [Actinomadura sp. WMMB 499]QFG21059.1 hypothetical protein F7P10_07805 [Actinomadura sp. WMMB 499]